MVAPGRHTFSTKMNLLTNCVIVPIPRIISQLQQKNKHAQHYEPTRFCLKKKKLSEKINACMHTQYITVWLERRVTVNSAIFTCLLFRIITGGMKYFNERNACTWAASEHYYIACNWLLNGSRSKQKEWVDSI